MVSEETKKLGTQKADDKNMPAITEKVRSLVNYAKGSDNVSNEFCKLQQNEGVSLGLNKKLTLDVKMLGIPLFTCFKYF